MAANTRIQVRRGYSANYTGGQLGTTPTGVRWLNTGPAVLAEGEIGYEIDTGKFKIGKYVSGGLATWSGLPYAGGSALISETGIGFQFNDSNNAYTLYSYITGIAGGQDGITFQTLPLSGLLNDTSVSGTYYTIGLSAKIENFQDSTISISGGNISGAVTFTNNVTLSGNLLDSAGQELNTIINKLIPPKPPAFPNNQSLTINGASNRLICSNFTQPTNSNNDVTTPTAGLTVSSVLVSSYVTSSITGVGFNPLNTGTITLFKNNTSAGSKNFVEFTSSINNNGPVNDLVIDNNRDYSAVNTAVASGFWQIFNTNGAGSLSSGWNVVSISGVGRTVSVTGYYDANSTSVPVIGSGSVATGVGGALVYSSSVPHYSGAITIAFSGRRLSGDTYPTTFTNNIGASSGLNAIGTRTRVSLGLPDILPQNCAVSAPSGMSYTGASALANSFATVASGSFGPTISISNSAGNSNNLTITPTTNFLIKTQAGSISGVLQEDNMPVSTNLSDSYGVRIAGYNYGNTPTSGTISAWNSQTTTLGSGDAALVGKILSHNLTNYSSGYTPVGPNLNANSRSAGTPQYFTFRFTAKSEKSKIKFKIGSSTGIAGLWIKAPNNPNFIQSSITYNWDTQLSASNGWIDATKVGTTAFFTDTDIGCSDGAPVPTGSPINYVNEYVVSFRQYALTVIDIRIKLNDTQSINNLFVDVTT